MRDSVDAQPQTGSHHFVLVGVLVAVVDVVLIVVVVLVVDAVLVFVLVAVVVLI